MQRQDHVDHRGQLAKHVNDPGRRLGPIHVRRTMDRDRRVDGRKTQAITHHPGVEAVEVVQQGVDHRVADEVDAVGGDPFAFEVDDPFRRRDEKQIREEVGDAPVDFLGHRVVEAAKPGLDVGHRDQELGRHQRRRERRVDVPVDDDQRRPGLREQRLDPDQHRGCLRGVRS